MAFEDLFLSFLAFSNSAKCFSISLVDICDSSLCSSIHLITVVNDAIYLESPVFCEQTNSVPFFANSSDAFFSSFKYAWHLVTDLKCTAELGSLREMGNVNK